MKSLRISLLLCAFILNIFVLKPLYGADYISLPALSKFASLSSNQIKIFNSAFLTGLVVNPNKPMQFDFLINRGQANFSVNEKNKEYTKLIKYFLAALALSDKEQWVNLSPYEKDKIIPDNFSKTQMGRDLLNEDYLLKQISAAMLHPDSEIGKKFWDRVYEQTAAKYGKANIPVNTFNKVWIVPDQAVVYEKDNTAYVLKSHLKVMLEEDYLSRSKHEAGPATGSKILSTKQHPSPGGETREKLMAPAASDKISDPVSPANSASTIASNIIREIIIPELEREVNEGESFAQLRQIFSAMILATWYKKALKDSLLAKVYVDQQKIKGLEYKQSLPGDSTASMMQACPLGGCQAGEQSNVKAPQGNDGGQTNSSLTGPTSLNDVEQIYQQYLQAFKKGVFNIIKDDIDGKTGQKIPRKYFSGGMRTIDTAMITRITDMNQAAQFIDQAAIVKSHIDDVTVKFSGNEMDQRDRAMLTAQKAFKGADQLENMLNFVQSWMMGHEQSNEALVISVDQEILRKLQRLRDKIDFSKYYFVYRSAEDNNYAETLLVFKSIASFVDELNKLKEAYETNEQELMSKNEVLFDLMDIIFEFGEEKKNGLFSPAPFSAGSQALEVLDALEIIFERKFEDFVLGKESFDKVYEHLEMLGRLNKGHKFVGQENAIDRPELGVFVDRNPKLFINKPVLISNDDQTALVGVLEQVESIDNDNFRVTIKIDRKKSVTREVLRGQIHFVANDIYLSNNIEQEGVVLPVDRSDVYRKFMGKKDLDNFVEFVQGLMSGDDEENNEWIVKVDKFIADKVDDLRLINNFSKYYYIIEDIEGSKDVYLIFKPISSMVQRLENLSQELEYKAAMDNKEDRSFISTDLSVLLELDLVFNEYDAQIKLSVNGPAPFSKVNQAEIVRDALKNIFEHFFYYYAPNHMNLNRIKAYLYWLGLTNELFLILSKLYMFDTSLEIMIRHENINRFVKMDKPRPIWLRKKKNNIFGLLLGVDYEGAINGVEYFSVRVKKENGEEKIFTSVKSEQMWFIGDFKSPDFAMNAIEDRMYINPDEFNVDVSKTIRYANDNNDRAAISHLPNRNVSLKQSDYGGIDFNTDSFDLQIKRDGNGVVLPIDQQDLAVLSQMDGLTPTILQIKPLESLPMLAELTTIKS